MFDFYLARSTYFPRVQKTQMEDFAPLPVSARDISHLPFLSEFGYACWLLPSDFMTGLFTGIAQRECQKGNNSGRFSPPCASAKYPIILTQGGNDFSGDGAWLTLGGTGEWGMFHELMHSVLTNVLGLLDDRNGAPPNPTLQNSQLSGMTLATLMDGVAIFGEATNIDCLQNTATNTCPNAALGRPVGFTPYGNSDNYSLSTRQHAFIGAIYDYFMSGTQFRGWVRADLNAGNDLLERKYNWLRDNIFQGVEFSQDAEPV